MQTDSLSPPPRSLAVSLQAGIKQVGCCRCPARRHALMGAVFGGHPAALQPRDALLRWRRRSGWRSARVSRGACLPPPPPPPCPQGEEQLMGTCDFFHQSTQTHPSRTRGGRWGKGTGGKKKKKLFLAPRRVARVLAQREGGPPAPGRDCGEARPRPSSTAGILPAPLRAPQTPPPGRGPGRGGGREAWRVGGGRDADWGKRPVPPRRLPGSGGASEALVPSAAPGRRRGALLAVAAAGGGRAHGGAGPI